MEPLVVLSVICNAIQLTETGIKVLSKTKEIYDSSDGSLEENNTLEIVTHDLDRLTCKVRSAFDTGDVPTVLTEDDTATLALCAASASQSQELLDALEKLKVKGDLTRWRSLRKALKSMWRKEKIQGHAAQMSSLRSQLNTRMLVKLRTDFDLARLQSSEDFARLETSVQQVVVDCVQSMSHLEITVVDAAARVQTSIATRSKQTEDVIITAVEDASVRAENSNTVVQSSLARIEDSSRRQEDQVDAATTTLETAITASSSSNALEHEETRLELTRKWQSAEVQIAELRKEIKEIEGRLAETIRKAVGYGGRPEDKTQRLLNEQANILHKIKAAKDFMLQKLLEFVESIKSAFSGSTLTSKLSTWRLQPYRAQSPASGLQHIDPSSGFLQAFRAQPSTIELVRFEGPGGFNYTPVDELMAAIQAANLAKCERLIPTTALNQRVSRALDVGLFDARERGFYRILFGSKDVIVPEGSLMFKITPLIFATLACRMYRASHGEGLIAGEGGPREDIVSLLLSAGANRHFKGGADLTAYDHARILALGEGLLESLDPSLDAKNILDAVRQNTLTMGLGRAELCYTLDAQRLSPISLAVGLAWQKPSSTSTVNSSSTATVNARTLSIIQNLRDMEASPFAQYISEAEIFPSLALGLAFASNKIQMWRHSADDSFVRTCAYVYGSTTRHGAPNSTEEAVNELLLSYYETWSASGKPKPFQQVSRTIRHQDALTIMVVMDQLALASDFVHKAGRTWHGSASTDVLRWPLYVAIRLGNADFRRQLQAYNLDVMVSKEVPRNALQVWWPLRCDCNPAIHNQFDRTLLEYARALTSADLCQWCEPLRPSFEEVVSDYNHSKFNHNNNNDPWGAWESNAGDTARLEGSGECFELPG